MYLTPAFRPNDSGDPMFGVPIKSGESQTRNGKWESIYTSQELFNKIINSFMRISNIIWVGIFK